MAMTIWLSGFDRTCMITNQRSINQLGSMQAVCLLSSAHLANAISGTELESPTVMPPSLIVFDYDALLAESFSAIHTLRQSPSLAGIPLFFAVRERSMQLDEECYENGAVVVVHKKLSRAEILRVENTAWRFENTRQFEQQVQKQASELRSAKEIYRLNTQLTARNKLLYKVFGRYFSDDVVDVILDNPDEVSLGGEKRRATILIADLRGFTHISESLDPVALTTMLNYFFDQMVDVILAHHGTVIEYLGDGLLAVFGTLLHNTGHQVQHALRAAIAMQNAMGSVNEYCRQNGFPELDMGIGLHTGDVLVGNIGSKRMMRYNVIGSAVNICSRIEGYSVGGQILASKAILDDAGCEVCYQNTGAILAKGSAQPLELFAILGLGGEHACSVTDPSKDERIFLSPGGCFVRIYPLSGKIISDNMILARVLDFSTKRIRVLLPKNSASTLSLFDNVALSAYVHDEKADTGGIGWFAKVTGQEQAAFVLHFTQSDEETHRTLQSWLHSIGA